MSRKGEKVIAQIKSKLLYCSMYEPLGNFKAGFFSMNVRDALVRDRAYLTRQWVTSDGEMGGSSLLSFARAICWSMLVHSPSLSGTNHDTEADK